MIAERPVESHAAHAAFVADLAERLARSLQRVQASPPVMRDHASIDESAILNRFLFRNAGHPALIPIPRADDGALAVDADALARSVLAVRDDDLATLDARKAGDTEEEQPSGDVRRGYRKRCRFRQ